MAEVQADISIHALHEESDRRVEGRGPAAYISIHALHEESDFAHEGFQTVVTFQSTLSMRRATPFLGEITEIPLISIHALHEESDSINSPFSSLVAFQSTLSMRRATANL